MVVHTCSGTTNPLVHVDLLRDVVAPFWDAAPPPHRFIAGPYPTCDEPHSYMDEATWHFWARCRLGDLKFWAIAALLRLLGYAAVSARVWSGWQARRRPCGCLCMQPGREMRLQDLQRGG